MNAVFLALQILITISVGVIGRKLKIVDADMIKKVSPLLTELGIPCLVVYTFAILEFDAESFRSALILMLVCLFEVVLLYILGFALRVFIKDSHKRSIASYSSIFSNATFMGIPIVQGLYGAEGMFYYMMFNMPIRILYYVCIPLLLAPHDEKKFDFKEILGVLKSPPLVALYIAIAIYLLQIKLPSFILNPLGNINTLVSTMGIIMIGITVADVNVKEVLKDLSNLILPIEKVVVAPLVTLFVLKLLFSGMLPPISIAVSVMYAALPMATMTTVFATKYYEGETVRWISLETVISTLLSVATIPALAVIMEFVLF